MTAIATIVLADSTPANNNFVPTGKDAKGVTTYMTQESIYDARRVLTVSVSQPSAGARNVRARIKVVVPVMDVVDTSIKVDEVIADLSVQLPKSSTATHRLDSQAFIKNALADAVATAIFTNFEGVY